MSDTVAAYDLHPDVLDLVQKIVDETKLLVTGVESLDANNWLTHADKIDKMNEQLQSMLVTPPPAKSTTKK